MEAQEAHRICRKGKHFLSFQCLSGAFPFFQVIQSGAYILYYKKRDVYVETRPLILKLAQLAYSTRPVPLSAQRTGRDEDCKPTNEAEAEEKTFGQVSKTPKRTSSST